MAFLGSFLKVVSIGLFIASIPATGGLSTGLVIGAMVTGTLGSMLNAPKIPEQQQQVGMSLDPGAPLPVVYGRAKVGSIVADWFLDPDTDAKILYEIVALCHGSRDGFGIGGIDELWINGRLAVVNPTSGELAESGGNDVREHPFVLPCLDYQLFLGTTTQNVGNEDFSGLFAAAGTKSLSDVTDSDWSATTDTGKGIAAIALRCANLLTYVVAGGGKDKAKQPTFSGPPAVTAIVRGNFVEDFRSHVNITGQPVVTPASIQFTNVGAADTITSTDARAVFDTWQAGDRVVVSGSASNNGTYTVASVTSTVLTLTAAAALVNEGPTSAPTLKRWAAPSNGGDNPALCVRDYLLSTIYGCGFDESLIDEYSFRIAADYCDVLLDYPLTAATEQATRYTCNGVVDTRRSTRENLDALCTACRGQLVWQQGQFHLTIRGSENQIDNPEYETDVLVTSVVNGSTVVHSTAQAHSGTGSCKITTANLSASGARIERRRLATEPYEDGYPVVVGRDYTLSLWAYAPGGSVGKTMSLILGCTDGIGGGITPSPQTDTVLVAGWQYIEVTGAILTGTIDVEPYFITPSALGVFDVYIDDVSFGPSAVIALTPRNIVGQWAFQNAGNAERWNLVTASYVDPLNGEFKAAQTQWPPIGSNAYLTADNDFLNRLDLSLPFTNDQAMAQAIAQITLNEARNGISCQVTCTEEAILAAVGDRVTVTHDTPGWDAKPFWVAHVELLPNTNVRLSLTEYQPTAYALDTMEDRRTYAATSHVPLDSPDSFPDDGFGPYDLVRNGNFEARSTNWTFGQGAVIEDGADVYAGSYSVEFPLVAADPIPPFLQQVADAGDVPLIVRVQPGETIRLSGTMKFSSAVTGVTYTLFMQEYDADGAASGVQIGPTWATEVAYTTKSSNVTVGAGVYFVNIVVAGTAVVNSGSAWIDELHMFRTTAP